MVRKITSMHEVVSAYAVADTQPDNFRRVEILHAVYADTGNTKEALAERSPINACMVTCRLADGGYVTVWPNGIVQVSDSNGNVATNYIADTASAFLNLADIQPER